MYSKEYAESEKLSFNDSNGIYETVSPRHEMELIIDELKAKIERQRVLLSRVLVNAQLSTWETTNIVANIKEELNK